MRSGKVRVRINKVSFMLILVLLVAFLDGSILQSSVLGPQFRGKLEGVIVFFLLTAVSLLSQWVLVYHLRSTLLSQGAKNYASSFKLWLMIKIVQITISILFIIIIAQIIVTSSYFLPLVLIIIGASNFTSLLIFLLLFLKLVRWSRLRPDYTVLSFTFMLMSLCLNLFFMTLFLIDISKNINPIIEPNRCGLMCYSVKSVYFPEYLLTYLISFFSVMISSVILLKGFHTGSQKIKFWTALSAALILIVLRLEPNLIRNFVNLLNIDFIAKHYLNAILFDMIGPLAGIMAGLVFLFMSKDLDISSVKSSVVLISYGVMLLLSLNQSIGLSLFQYPPLGVLSISFIPVASYFLFLGVYFSAVYAAQDQKLRSLISSPKSPFFGELKFLSSIGKSENIQRVVSGISGIMDNFAEKMEIDSGLPSEWQENMDKYVKSVIDMKISMGAKHNDIRYYDISENPFGLSWADWVEKWWNWCYQVPNEAPIEDLTGQYCAKNQNAENIWFLAGTYGGVVHRKCVIPNGRAIFFPIVNDLISFYEYPSLQNEIQLHNYARSDLDETIEVTVFVDSNLIQDAKKFRIHTDIFEIAIPSKEDSSTLIPTKAVSDGYWLFLKPLPLGDHILHFVGEKLAYDEVQNHKETKRPPKFRVEVTYDIVIVDS